MLHNFSSFLIHIPILISIMKIFFLKKINKTKWKFKKVSQKTEKIKEIPSISRGGANGGNFWSAHRAKSVTLLLWEYRITASAGKRASGTPFRVWPMFFNLLEKKMQRNCTFYLEERVLRFVQPNVLRRTQSLFYVYRIAQQYQTK